MNEKEVNEAALMIGECRGSLTSIKENIRDLAKTVDDLAKDSHRTDKVNSDRFARMEQAFNRIQEMLDLHIKSDSGEIIKASDINKTINDILAAKSQPENIAQTLETAVEKALQANADREKENNNRVILEIGKFKLTPQGAKFLKSTALFSLVLFTLVLVLKEEIAYLVQLT